MTQNLKIFGEHEPDTIAQMHTSMSYGAEYGVLCADGHLGYSVPVGGVIAYEGKICVNGIGFDIACIDGETEFLSHQGWVKMNQWSNQEVLQYDKETDVASFVFPCSYVVKKNQKMVHFLHKDGMDQKMTLDHKMLIWKGYRGRGYNLQDYTANDFLIHHNTLEKGIQGGVKTTFKYYYDSQLPLSDIYLRIYIMVCADGSIIENSTKNNRIVIHLRKPRKIERCKRLLNNAKIFFKESVIADGSTYISFICPEDLNIETKDMGIFWRASTRQLEILGEECFYWDGHKGDHEFFSTTKKSEAEIVQFALATTGIRANIYLAPLVDNHKQNYIVYKTKNEIVGITKDCETYSEGEDAFCFTVPSGYFVARRNGFIFITGNCGNKAVLVDAPSEDVKSNIYRTMNEVQKHISFGVGRKNEEKVEHELFDDPLWGELPLLQGLKDKAVSQLGTVGSGNHYVDIFVDEQNRIWVGVHFGSRGLGHSICTHFIKQAGGKDGIHAEPIVLDENSDLGTQYLKCMALAGRYAYAGRDWVCDRVAKILRANIQEGVHNHHNFAWREHHFGKDLWVVRKGATPAFPGQRGFVGGSMGDISVILEGIDSISSTQALNSTIHGAGRAMGRTQARGKTCRKTGKQLTEGLVKREVHDTWMKQAGVEVRGGDLDESPLAYKRIEQVLDAHKETIKIVHTLKPIGVCMAGNDVRDPYKD